MSKYKKIDVSEQQLEDLVRRNAELIEDGLVYVDHQRQAAEGRLDVLLVDSGHSLVVAELKVIEDDGMLLQALDYYDHVAARIENYARLYKGHVVDPTQPVRLLLIAPSFSQTLINRCKWIDAPISLFTYTCLSFDKSDDVTPVFAEQAIASPPEAVIIPKVDDHLKYITDPTMHTAASGVVDEVRKWNPSRITIDALQYALSMKVDGRVFAYLHPRRKHFIVSTYNAENKWTDYRVQSKEELNNIVPIVKASMERNSAKRAGTTA